MPSIWDTGWLRLTFTDFRGIEVKGWGAIAAVIAS